MEERQCSDHCVSEDDYLIGPVLTAQSPFDEVSRRQTALNSLAA